MRRVLRALGRRSVWTSAVEVAGLVLVAVGAGLIFPPAGLIVAGGGLVAIGVQSGGDE